MLAKSALKPMLRAFAPLTKRATSAPTFVSGTQALVKSLNNLTITSARSYALTSQMSNSKTTVEAQIKLYKNKLRKCGEKKNAEKVFTVMNDMRILGVPKTEEHYNIAFNSIIKSRQLDHAHKFIDLIKGNGETPSAKVYNTMIAACAGNKDAESAQRYFDEMVSLSSANATYAPTLTTYNNMLTAYALANNDGIFRIFDRMVAEGHDPNTRSYKTLTLYHANNKDLAKALEVFNTMKQNGVQVDRSIYTALIKACKMPEEKQNAIDLFNEMEQQRIPRDADTYSAIIDAMHQCQDAEAANNYYQMMKDRRVKPKIKTFIPLLKLGLDDPKPSRAKFLLKEMRRFHLEPEKNAQVIHLVENIIARHRQKLEAMRAERREVRQQYRASRREARAKFIKEYNANLKPGEKPFILQQ
eukprot:GEZU01003845.1.p1 GENE.GEZU01003845.1~~GEZU01003845.1.p1  ORF type:complete len:430 (+),score=122.82 GEZU01003845.1:51-1292(+)